MARLLMWWPRDRRQAQSGATLVELLVSVTIMGLALTLIIGTFSTGLLDSAISKRNTAATAVIKYELNQIDASAYDPSAQNYSDCFATESAGTAPTTVATFGGACPSNTYTLRADVTVASGPGNAQFWTIQIISWPANAKVGSQVETVRAIR
jgi:type II secretory pathway pseudopilin PulG